MTRLDRLFLEVKGLWTLTKSDDFIYLVIWDEHSGIEEHKFNTLGEEISW